MFMLNINKFLSSDFYTILLLIVIFILLFLLFKAASLQYGTKYRRRWGKHYKLGKLLTKNEYSFYMSIRKQLPNDILLFPKVRMEDFLDIVALDKMRYRGYVRCRHVDFLVCNPSLQILCGIELDDSSHNTKQAKQVDKLKNDIFKEIKIPLIRVYNNKKGINDAINKIIKLNKNQS